jgi:hypothetical protein
VETAGANFSGRADITPEDLNAKGAGKERIPAFKYDYSQTFDGDTIGSRAESTSGGAYWNGSANANKKDGSKDSLLIAKDYVENGTLKGEYYNAEHSFANGVETEGAYYSESGYIAPAELVADGYGANRLTAFAYSYSQTFDGDTMGCGAASTSGAAFWHSSTNSSLEAEAQDATLQASNAVYDGLSQISYFNPDLTVTETLETKDSNYFQRADLTAWSIDAKGGGNTTNIENDAEDNRGFREVIRVNRSDEWGKIETYAIGDINAQWKSAVASNLSQYSFGMGLTGSGSFMNADELEMVGEAWNVPRQVLPGSTINYSFSNNGVAVNEGEDTTEDYYLLNMEFSVKDDRIS